LAVRGLTDVKGVIGAAVLIENQTARCGFEEDEIGVVSDFDFAFAFKPLNADDISQSSY
jgi:hypothetical protein